MVIQLPVATWDPGPARPRAILLHFRARQDISERIGLWKELAVTDRIMYPDKVTTIITRLEVDKVKPKGWFKYRLSVGLVGGWVGWCGG